MTGDTVSSRLAVLPAPVQEPAATGPESARPELLPLDAGEQYRFGFEMSACIGCHSCEVACSEQNGLPTGTVWRRVGELEGGDHPTTRRFHLSMSCNQCLEPACLEGCPTNAYEKLANGVVAHHADDCIGCQYCTWNCPYSVPVFQPDRRIVTKCDMCQPRLGEGLAPACVDACPTHAITIEAVDTETWRADHRAGNAPGLPDASISLSTTRISLPDDLPADALEASSWNLRPEHPHWPLVWLTLVSQLSVGMSLAATTDQRWRIGAALVAGVALAGAPVHLGRPAVAWKALRNLRRSWLSREAAALAAYAALAGLATVFPSLAAVAAAMGVAGIYASARLYVVPGRPAWNTSLTLVRFAATTATMGPAVTGHPKVAVAGALASVGATALNWWRLARRGGAAERGSVSLELRTLRWWTILRLSATAGGVLTVMMGGPSGLAAALMVGGEAVARWLFFVTVVPLNMPGSFWRRAAGSHR